MLTANSAAILTDAFPADQRGFALGINQVAAIAGQFIGLVAGGLLAALDWRARVLGQRARSACSAPCGPTASCATTASATAAGSTGGATSPSPSGSGAILIAITNGIQPYHGHTMGWTNPVVIGC